MPQECALLQVGLIRQLLALQDLQEQLRRKSWRAVEAEAKAVKEASHLSSQLAAAQASNENLSSQLAEEQASNESTQQEVKRLEQDVERLEQQLVGSQAAAAPKEQQLVVTQVQSHSVYTCLSCTSLML